MWFHKWFVSDRSLFKSFQNFPYSCSNIPNTTLETFYMSEQACLFSHEVYVFMVTVQLILLLIALFTTTFYRFRWHIRLALYEEFRGPDNRWRRLQGNHFQYDVFVSYAEEDSGWVRQHLMPGLEDRLGLRLCLHQRDFHPGRHIVDSIAECVERSKKAMMLFSSDFAKSPWCQFELALCLTHVIDNNDALVITCLHDIASRDLTPTMMAVMKTTTYIEWAYDPDAMASFWGRLRIAFNEIIPSVGH
nr:hypothetical protein BaRGS_029377 [Batillaria attramentaria]